MILTVQFKCLFWHEPRDRGGYNDKGVADICISYVRIKFCSFQIQVLGIDTQVWELSMQSRCGLLIHKSGHISAILLTLTQFKQIMSM